MIGRVSLRSQPSDPAATAGRTIRPFLSRSALPLLFVLELSLWAVLILGAGLFRAGPNGKGLSTDFGVFSGASNALAHGANPYDNLVLYHFERALLLPQRIPITSVVENVRAGNPPLFYWLIEPFLRLPYPQAALLWMAVMAAATLAGFLACARALNARRVIPALLLFALMPQVVLGACYGNLHGVVLLALGLCLWLGRRYPALAGFAACLGWLKPQIAFPLLGLVFLFQIADRRTFAVAFVAGSAALAAATVAVVGATPFSWWFHGLVSWSGNEGLEPNLSSLVGLYAGWADPVARTGISLAAMLIASVLTWWQWRGLAGRLDPTLRETAWLWFVWFLAAPFAHFPDELVLAPAVLAIASVAPRAATRVCYLAFFSLALFPATIPQVNFLSLVVAACALLLWQARPAHSAASTASASVTGAVRAL